MSKDWRVEKPFILRHWFDPLPNLKFCETKDTLCHLRSERKSEGYHSQISIILNLALRIDARKRFFHKYGSTKVWGLAPNVLFRYRFYFSFVAAIWLWHALSPFLPPTKMGFRFFSHHHITQITDSIHIFDVFTNALVHLSSILAI
jgi:hypothetical protein